MDQPEDRSTSGMILPNFKPRSRSKGNKVGKRTRTNFVDTETKTNPLLFVSSKKKKIKDKEEEQEKQSDKNISNVQIKDNEQDNVNNSSKDKATALPIEKEDQQSKSKKKKPFGPMRAPTNIRVTVRLDYQPDVCKDYKETGYCGFGDSCKFLHDRSDYKAGWQLEKDYAEQEKIRKEKLLRGENPNLPDVEKEDVDHDEDGLPFACFICRKDFNNPIMTLCGHYFCEKCALKRMNTNTTCAICKQPLRETFNPAPKLIEKIRKKKGSH